MQLFKFFFFSHSLKKEGISLPPILEGFLSATGYDTFESFVTLTPESVKEAEDFVTTLEKEDSCAALLCTCVKDITKFRLLPGHRVLLFQSVKKVSKSIAEKKDG